MDFKLNFYVCLLLEVQMFSLQAIDVYMFRMLIFNIQKTEKMEIILTIFVENVE